MRISIKGVELVQLMTTFTILLVASGICVRYARSESATDHWTAIVKGIRRSAEAPISRTPENGTDRVALSCPKELYAFYVSKMFRAPLVLTELKKYMYTV